MSLQSNNLHAIERLIGAFNKATGRSLQTLPACCDNEVDANDCANLVLQNIKTVTKLLFVA
ncbi:MAG TPA: hypothetical protein ENH88_20915 [Pseudoalteromonas prydzensis]|uniref:Uncharacterized protein n=1 Tax=Pseudoalteromonas prydzensis TaxID=182141 RepID=A0A7V1GGK0_9GAMM|nr:hypothetical protein [Pseudoalteromonas prydzensis]HEA18863.1 hypothetical protein [Pseudoalteromonas prydzensis]